MFVGGLEIGDNVHWKVTTTFEREADSNTNSRQLNIQFHLQKTNDFNTILEN